MITTIINARITLVAFVQVPSLAVTALTPTFRCKRYKYIIPLLLHVCRGTHARSSKR
jgi:hypothetical protein